MSGTDNSESPSGVDQHNAQGSISSQLSDEQFERLMQQNTYSTQKTRTPAYKKAWFWVLIILGGLLLLCIVLAIVFVVVFGNTSSTSSTSSSPTYSNDVKPPPQPQRVTSPLTFGSTFEFDDLEITIGTNISVMMLDNEYSDHHGATVLSVPITTTNLSSENHSLISFYVKMFGSRGAELSYISAYFSDDDDKNILEMGEVRPGATVEGYYYFLYDGNGEYYLEFESFTEGPTEAVLPIQIQQ